MIRACEPTRLAELVSILVGQLSKPPTGFGFHPQFLGFTPSGDHLESLPRNRTNENKMMRLMCETAQCREQDMSAEQRSRLGAMQMGFTGFCKLGAGGILWQPRRRIGPDTNLRTSRHARHCERYLSLSCRVSCSASALSSAASRMRAEAVSESLVVCARRMSVSALAPLRHYWSLLRTKGGPF